MAASPLLPGRSRRSPGWFVSVPFVVWMAVAMATPSAARAGTSPQTAPMPKGAAENATPQPVAEPAATPEPQDVPFQLIELPNGGFEAGAENWKLAENLARVSPEAAFSGSAGLRLESPQNDKGASVVSSRLPVKPDTVYELSWQGRVLNGSGTTLFLRFFDAQGQEVAKEIGRVNTDRGNQWTESSLRIAPPSEAREMDIFIQRVGQRSPDYLVDLDDFQLREKPLHIGAPWPGTYKLRPKESARLTAADVIGPDGRVYPDWTSAGVPGGIPEVKTVVRLGDLGARPETDIAPLLEQAAAKAAELGGGAVEIGEGTFFLDEPVVIFADNVVIRGAGRDKTKLLFRYHIPAGELRFFRIRSGETLGPDSVIEFHVNPRDLVSLELKAGATSLTRRARRDHWGNTFSLRIPVPKAIETVGEGNHTLTAIAEYEDGKRIEKSIDLTLSKTASSRPFPAQLGAINLVGRGPLGEPIPLVADAPRGTKRLQLPENHGLNAGDRISIVAPASERWRKLVGHTSQWGSQAANIAEIAAVDGGTVTLTRPLRSAFPAMDGSTVQPVQLISGSGLENFELEQVVVPNQPPPGPKNPQTLWYPIDDLWTSGVTCSHAWGCWMKGIAVRNTGRNAAYFPMTKHLEIRDCVFDESLFKGGGGTGYIGFERSWDCLMDTVEARGMRHAPNVQWSASGNVIRNGRFIGSDGQWHAGWTSENLFENNEIDARGDGGSYGHGLYASGPSSGIHGPQGPRNVAYNNDVVAKKDCLHMLGGNEAWMIMYNRFTTGDGRAIYAKEKSFDHIIEGNVFILKQGQSPAVLLGPDSVGVELVNNAFYGVTPPYIGFTAGSGKLMRDEGNTWTEDIPRPLPARPEPAVRSIFEWQRANAAAIREAAEARASGGTP